jgi:hypothetical protein
MALRRKQTRNRIGRSNYQTALETQLALLDRVDRGVPASEASVDKGKLDPSKVERPHHGEAIMRIRRPTRHEMRDRVKSLNQTCHHFVGGLNRSASKLDISLTNTICNPLDITSRPPRSSIENVTDQSRRLRPYVPIPVDTGAKRPVDARTSERGKLANVAAAIKHILQKAGSVDNLRRHLMTWSREPGTNDIKPEEFVKRLELMGFNVTRGEVDCLAGMLRATADHTCQGLDGHTRHGIPMKELASAALLISDKEFEAKFNEGRDHRFLAEAIARTGESRSKARQDKMFVHRFCKFKDQIYNALKDEADLSPSSLFNRIGHLGFSLDAVTEADRAEFTRRYLSVDKTFDGRRFYDEMNEALPNKKMQVATADVRGPC